MLSVLTSLRHTYKQAVLLTCVPEHNGRRLQQLQQFAVQDLTTPDHTPPKPGWPSSGCVTGRRGDRNERDPSSVHPTTNTPAPLLTNPVNLYNPRSTAECCASALSDTKWLYYPAAGTGRQPGRQATS